MTVFKSSLIFFLLIGSLIFSEFIRPVPNSVDVQDFPSLESSIPISFEGWHSINQGLPQIVDPQAEKSLDAIYSQTLSRIYVDKQQEKIILSLAYGPNQTEPLRVHKPEVCYPAQGFNIESNEVGQLEVSGQEIPVKFLKGVSSDYTEFVTYWIVVGGVAVATDLGFKLQQFKFSLDGKIPDGLLFRVSSHGQDAKAEYQKQKRFVNDLINNVDLETRKILLGEYSR
ncbi:exosortase-associated protein EpsI, B-type [Thiomicrorhabdus arctica]|uniref:exosortase-associated protein EpsI, B-type n=1 Tax=Thiomicrorhabdus arctica TaxID=131540 RepID=UPI00035C6F48|nr:exosortase-associated protein EpsI, B-type [Thiomicrorhabdus arctica]